jgi:hypothetical protein
MNNPSIPSAHSAQALPSGTVTFLFTDIEGSTKLAQEHPDTWESMREHHHAILQSAIESHNGYVFQIVGDSFSAAFHVGQQGVQGPLCVHRLPAAGISKCLCALKNVSWPLRAHASAGGKPNNDLLLIATLAFAFLFSLPSFDQLLEWLLTHWCHRTGKWSLKVKAPLYRLRSALSRLWLTHPLPLIGRLISG